MAACLAVAALVACASIEAGDLQRVSVDTPGCPGATCELGNDKGRWLIESTPAAIEVIRSRAELQIACRAPAAAGAPSAASVGASSPPIGAGSGAAGAIAGAAAASAPVLATPLAPVAVVFVAWGAVAGAGVGRAVDASTRASGYPQEITVPLACGGPEVPLPFPLGVALRGLTDAEARSAGRPDRAGAIVTGVTVDGRAGAAGLRTGDIVLAVAGQPVADAAQFEEFARALPAGAGFALRVWRAATSLEIVVPAASPR